MYDLVLSGRKKDFVFKVEITKQNRTFRKCEELLFSPPVFHFLYHLFIVPTLSPFSFIPSPSLFYVLLFFLNRSSFSFLSTSAFFLVSVSISFCTPTRSGIACYTRRIAPCTLTLCWKSFKENIKVFLKQTCIISEFGSSLCSCPGVGPVLQFYCCSAAAFYFAKIQGRRQAGRGDYSANT